MWRLEANTVCLLVGQPVNGLESRICKNSDGDDNGGHNSDASVVGESNGVTIINAIIKNQDDCLAVNSGTVSTDQNILTRSIDTDVIEQVG